MEGPGRPLTSPCPSAPGHAENPPQPPAGTSQEGALGARELPPAPWSMVLSLPEPEAVCPACCRETSGDAMRAGRTGRPLAVPAAHIPVQEGAPRSRAGCPRGLLCPARGSRPGRVFPPGAPIARERPEISALGGLCPVAPPPASPGLASGCSPDLPLPGCCMRPSDTLPPSPVPGLPGAWAPWSAPPPGQLQGPVPGAGPGRPRPPRCTRGSSEVSSVACRLGPRSPGLGEEAGGSRVVSSGEEGRQPAGAGDGVRVAVGAVSKGGGIRHRGAPSTLRRPRPRAPRRGDPPFLFTAVGRFCLFFVRLVCFLREKEVCNYFVQSSCTCL